MVITQPYRILVKEAIKRNSRFITGTVLDAGSGSVDRYSDFFVYDKYLKLDVDPKSGADIIASIENIPLPSGSVDSVVCTGVLGDVFQPVVPIMEFNRILKENGYCLFTDNFSSLMHNQPYDYFRFTDFYLKKLFLENGFEVVVLERIGSFHSAMLQLSVEYLVRRFNLYNHELLGRLASRLFYLLFLISRFLDCHDRNSINNCSAIAWLIVAKKLKNSEDL